MRKGILLGSIGAIVASLYMGCQAPQELQREEYPILFEEQSPAQDFFYTTFMLPMLDDEKTLEDTVEFCPRMLR